MLSNRFYRNGLSIGAALPAGEWTLDQYKAKARSLWADISAPYAVVAIERRGAQSMAVPVNDKTKASDLYGAFSDRPGRAVYLAYFDRAAPAGDALIDEAFFQPTDIETIKTERVASPGIPAPVKAIGLVGILGLLALIAKH